MPSADVLIVNDRMMDAQTTLVAFEQVAPRARVLHLMTGSEALQYLFSAGLFAGRAPVMPQLVVLSLEMKGISGLCLLDLVRAHPLTREIPIVLVGLEVNPRIYRRHDQFDASAYLMMPWDFGRYCAVIEGCTSRWLPWALRPVGLPHGGRFKTSTMLKPRRAPKFDTPHQAIDLTLPSLNLAT
jgi:two-component system response regulator